MLQSLKFFLLFRKHCRSLEYYQRQHNYPEVTIAIYSNWGAPVALELPKLCGLRELKLYVILKK